MHLSHANFASEIGHLATSSKLCANVQHEIGRQLCAMMCLSSHTAHTSFCGCIGDVVGLSAEEKMGRIDASAIIATMEDGHSSRNRAVPQFVRNTVREDVVICRCAGANASMATRGFGIGRACPKPTFIRRPFDEKFAEADFNRDALSATAAPPIYPFLFHVANVQGQPSAVNP